MFVSFLLVTALIIQYTVLAVILYFRKDWLDPDGLFGIAPWFPIVGPMAIGALICIITPIIALFSLPLGIYNIFEHFISKIRKD